MEYQSRILKRGDLFTNKDRLLALALLGREDEAMAGLQNIMK